VRRRPLGWLHAPVGLPPGYIAPKPLLETGTVSRLPTTAEQ